MKRAAKTFQRDFHLALYLSFLISTQCLAANSSVIAHVETGLACF